MKMQCRDQMTEFYFEWINADTANYDASLSKVKFYRLGH